MSNQYVARAWETAESLRKQVLLQSQAGTMHFDEYEAWQRAVKEAKSVEALWMDYDGLLGRGHDTVRSYEDDEL